MSCIFCGSKENLNTIEHIVNESLINYQYTLEKGAICINCNNNFSKFERKVLSKTIIGLERARFGVVTKKGKPAKAKTGTVGFEGDKDFRKNYIKPTGLESAEIDNFDPKTKTFTLTVDGFDKSQMATSKLLLKMGFESLYQSQRKYFKKQNFSELKKHLTNQENFDWPFITTQKEINTFKSVVRHLDKYQLKKNHCELMFCEIDSSTILFKFRYGGFKGIINLVDRNIGWIIPYSEIDPIIGIHPEAIVKKVKPAANT